MKPLNVWSCSDEEIGRLTSNFAHTPFVLDGVEFASIEAFYAWLLLADKPTKREKVRRMWGLHAKHLIPKIKPARFGYGDETMDLGGAAHLALIMRALRTKFESHPEIARAFAATHPRPFIHETGHSDKPGAEFPRATFCRLLTELRDELLDRFPAVDETPDEKVASGVSGG